MKKNVTTRRGDCIDVFNRCLDLFLFYCFHRFLKFHFPLFWSGKMMII